MAKLWPYATSIPPKSYWNLELLCILKNDNPTYGSAWSGSPNFFLYYPIWRCLLFPHVYVTGVVAFSLKWSNIFHAYAAVLFDRTFDTDHVSNAFTDLICSQLCKCLWHSSVISKDECKTAETALLMCIYIYIYIQCSAVIMWSISYVYSVVPL